MRGNPDDLRTLDRAGCLALLSTAGSGRVALSERAMPIIVPVQYRVVLDGVLFAAAEPSLRTAAESSHVVCFQADAMSADGLLWSINVIGPLEFHVGAGEPPSATTTAQLRTAIVFGRVIPQRSDEPAREDSADVQGIGSVI